MSSRKAKAAAAGGKKKGEEGDTENILQAVVLTDSYQTRFRPLTLETPRCLLPIVNVPLIEYTLEFLALAGVQDVFIFVSAQSDKIEEYIRNSKWNRASSPFSTCQIVMSPTSMSVGDAMRELDGKNLITTDFLLVNGDYVSNLPLEGILAEHRKRRTANKDAIMTMILRESGFNHRTKARGESGAFVIDETTNQCVHYEEMRPYGESKIELPSDLLKKHPQLRIRSDLIDCQVDICSPDVPALFTENFDYQHIRRHFLHGILTDFDLYGKTIHTHIIDTHYAARVRSLQTYDSVSRDIIGRWAVPLVPDSNLNDSHSYTLERGNIYKESDVYLARSAIVNRNTVLGSGTSIGAGSVVTASVLGRNVRIGENVVLNRAYIWDNAVIENNCSITKSIIANNATIGANTLIEPGCIVSYDVSIAAGTTLRRFAKISNHKRKLASPDTHAHSDGAFSGSEYSPSDSESDTEQFLATLDGFENLALDTLSDASSISAFGSDSDSDSDSSESSTHNKPRKHIRSDSMASTTSDPDVSWHKEATSSLLTAMENNHPVEIASLELNGLRMTANANWHQVRRAICSALLSRIEQLVANDAFTNGKAAEKVLNDWKSLIKRAVHEKVDQIDLLACVQTECLNRKDGASLLLNVVQRLYDPLDLAEEAAVLKWWANEEGGEKVLAVREKTKAFITWLKEADEEESDEESEEETEEESDDE